MKRTCLLCGRERRWKHASGDHCAPCRLGLKAEAHLLRMFRRRSLARLTRVA